MTPPTTPSAGRRPRRWLGHPWLSATIAAVWLLLQGELSVASVGWALLLGLLLPRLLDGFLPSGPSPRAAGTALRLAATVLWDVVVANLVVARLALDPRAVPRPAWVRVRHGLRDERAVALLATLITTTPGTVSCVVHETAGEILVHALDTADPQALAADIVRRYAQPLGEIFG